MGVVRGRPRAGLVQEPGESRRHLYAPGGIWRRARPPVPQPGETMSQISFERVADGSGMVVQMLRDGRRPPAVGREQHHLDTIPLQRGQGRIAAGRLRSGSLVGC